MTNEEFIKSVSLEGEEWRDVVGLEGLYLVSNNGRIISLPRLRVGCYGCRYFSKIRLLANHKDKNGYWRNNNLQGKTSLIHRIVAESFISNPEHFDEVDHIDGNTSNCNVNNLRWCSSSMNKLNPNTRKRNSEARKGKFNEENGASKSIIIFNDTKVFVFPSIYEAKRNGFPRTCIHRCLANPKKEYNGYKVMYLSDYEALTNKSKNAIPNPN